MLPLRAMTFLLIATVIHAEDWTTTDGKTYQNVTVVSHDSTVVTVSYVNTSAYIAPSDLNKAIQQGIVGTAILPISSLDEVTQQHVLNDHPTELKASLPGSNAPEYVKALTDLCSQSPDVRSKAAEFIRDNHLYKSTPRHPWEKLAAGLKIGESVPEVIDYLHKRGIALKLSTLSRTNVVIHFPLDDSWVLLCAINHAVLTEYGIYEEPRETIVVPPPQFSGFWYTYRINGEAMRPCYYDRGKPMNVEAR